MTRTSVASAIAGISAKNAELAQRYREGAKSLLSRSVSSLAASMADQRRELGKELGSLAADLTVADTQVDIETDSSLFANPTPPQAGLLPDFLAYARKAENDDYELLTALSGALLPLSLEAANRIAAFADQARKRASWVQDHLDLLGL